MIAKKYLTFSMIEDLVVQDSYIAFAELHGVHFDSRPKFIGRKTVAEDIKLMSKEYRTKVLLY